MQGRESKVIMEKYQEEYLEAANDKRKVIPFGGRKPGILYGQSILKQVLEAVHRQNFSTRYFIQPVPLRHLTPSKVKNFIKTNRGLTELRLANGSRILFHTSNEPKEELRGLDSGEQIHIPQGSYSLKTPTIPSEDLKKTDSCTHQDKD